MTTRKPETAEDLVRRLSTDPEYLAAMSRMDAASKARERRLRRDEWPIKWELWRHGTLVRSVWSLIHRKRLGPRTIAVLTRHLRLGYMELNKVGMARALARAEAQSAVPVMTEELAAAPADGAYSAALADAIGAAAAAPEVLMELIDRDGTGADARAALCDRLISRFSAETAVMAFRAERVSLPWPLENGGVSISMPLASLSHLLGEIETTLVGTAAPSIPELIARVSGLREGEAVRFRIGAGASGIEGEVLLEGFESVAVFFGGEPGWLEQVERVLEDVDDDAP